MGIKDRPIAQDIKEYLPKNTILPIYYTHVSFVPTSSKPLDPQTQRIVDGVNLNLTRAATIARWNAATTGYLQHRDRFPDQVFDLIMETEHDIENKFGDESDDEGNDLTILDDYLHDPLTHRRQLQKIGEGLHRGNFEIMVQKDAEENITDVWFVFAEKPDQTPIVKTLSALRHEKVNQIIAQWRDCGRSLARVCHIDFFDDKQKVYNPTVFPLLVRKVAVLYHRIREYFSAAAWSDEMSNSLDYLKLSSEGINKYYNELQVVLNAIFGQSSGIQSLPEDELERYFFPKLPSPSGV